MAFFLASLSSSVLQATATGFGTGRLSAPGHGLQVLSVGRRAPRPVVLGLLLPSTTTGSTAWAVKSCAGAGSGSDSAAEEEDCELVSKFKVAVQTGQMFPLEPEYMDLPGLHEKVVFESLAESSFNLWVKVANRLRPSPNTEIYERLHQCGNLFSIGKIRKKAISWKRASDLTEGLDLLRRLVSSTLQVPLPFTWTLYAMVPMEFNNKREVSVIAQRIYMEVANDIDLMFRASAIN